jgi:hypothetical protein
VPVNCPLQPSILDFERKENAAWSHDAQNLDECSIL